MGHGCTRFELASALTTEADVHVRNPVDKRVGDAIVVLSATAKVALEERTACVHAAAYAVYRGTRIDCSLGATASRWPHWVRCPDRCELDCHRDRGLVDVVALRLQSKQPINHLCTHTHMRERERE